MFACPRLEALEDRTAPTSLVGQIVLPPPNPFAQQAAPQPSGGLTVTVVQNSGPTVIDLDALFGGANPEGGTQMSIVGNSNPGLVKPSLSDGELTLNYAPGQTGKATITIGVTEPDGTSVRETIIVTVY